MLLLLRIPDLIYQSFLQLLIALVSYCSSCNINLAFILSTSKGWNTIFSMTVWVPAPDIVFSDIDPATMEVIDAPDLPLYELEVTNTFQSKKFAEPGYTYDYGCLEFGSTGSYVDINHTNYTLGQQDRRLPWTLLNSFGIVCEFRIDSYPLAGETCLLGQNESSAMGQSIWSLAINSFTKQIHVHRAIENGGKSLETVTPAGVLVPAAPCTNRLVIWYRWDGAHWTHSFCLNGASAVNVSSDYSQFLTTSTQFLSILTVGNNPAHNGQLIGAIRQLKIYDCPVWTEAQCIQISKDGICPSKSLFMDFPFNNATEAINRVSTKTLVSASEEIIFPYDQKYVPPNIHSPLTMAFRCNIGYKNTIDDGAILGFNGPGNNQLYGLIWDTTDSAAPGLMFAYQDHAPTVRVHIGDGSYDENMYCIVTVSGTDLTGYITKGRDMSSIVSHADVRADDHFIAAAVDMNFYLCKGDISILGLNGPLWDVVMFWGLWDTNEMATYLAGDMPSRTHIRFRMSDSDTSVISRDGLLKSADFIIAQLTQEMELGTPVGDANYAPWLLHKGELVFP